MAQHTPKVLAQLLLGAGETTIYTVPQSTTTTFTALLVVNNGGAASYTLHLRAPTVAAANANGLAIAVAIAANAAVAFPLQGGLGAQGYVLSGLGSVANQIGIQLFGIETV